RQDEGGADQCGAEIAGPHPTKIDRQLRRQRSGGELRQRQPLHVVLLRNPSPSFDQIALHVAGKRDRSTKPKGPEPHEVREQLAQRTGRRLRRGSRRGRRFHPRRSASAAACPTPPSVPWPAPASSPHPSSART